MKSPFLFGKTVSEDNFTNRTKDIKRLKDNFTHHINTILISPRRWGKSSLVKKVADSVQSRIQKVVMIDLFSIRNEHQFYNVLATRVIKATSNKLEEWIHITKRFFKHLIPKISVGSDPFQDFEISFEWKNIDKNYTEILNLAEKIAKHKKIHIIICIDEFQSLANFREPLLFQKRLRTEWQHHHHVTYCLYGSQQHMMIQLFEKQSNPFYKFGDVMYLPKIERKDWITYIVHQFKHTHKNIEPELAAEIAAIVKDHSYYVQQLAHLVWIHTETKATNKQLNAAIDDLLTQNAMLYLRDTEELSTGQINFLKAVASGIHNGFGSKSIIDTYELNSSANAIKIKKALLQKELIDNQNGDIHFLDPVYALWFKKHILVT